MNLKKIFSKIKKVFFNRFIIESRNLYIRSTLKYGQLFHKKKLLPTLSIIREFHAPPYGGGNQYMLYLVKELRRMGFDVKINSFSKKVKLFIVDYCWFNSKFEKKIISHKEKYNSKLVHRIDGLLTEYSSTSRFELDELALRLNAYADLTIVQSQYSMNQFHENNKSLKKTKIIYNSVDRSIFYKRKEKDLNKNINIKLISSSWSANKNKGMDDYLWLDKNLLSKTYHKIEYCFVGRLDFIPKNIKLIKPQGQIGLANKFNDSDIFIYSAKNDTCPNVLLEAIACGLPVIYKNAGGPKELVKKFGLAYEEVEEIPFLLDEMIRNLDYFKNLVKKHRSENAPEQYAKELLKLI